MQEYSQAVHCCSRHGIEFNSYCYKCEYEVLHSGRYQRRLEAELADLDYERGPSQEAFDKRAGRILASEARNG